MIVDEKIIFDVLGGTSHPSKEIILSTIKKAEEKKGLDLEEVGFLVNLTDMDLIDRLFEAASRIKDEIYGERLVFFAPLYVSDYCVNACAYCNFHSGNKAMRRKRLTMEEIERETLLLIEMGHKRVLLECGEDRTHCAAEYAAEAIEKIYSVKTDRGNIRRINVNIAATTVENYQKLKAANIGTYQLFQETYHRKTYEKLHRGPKGDYDRQITAHDRAFEAGLDDLGIGVLFGLYDWRFELLSLVTHAKYMDKTFGVGPHTISVPRFRPAPEVKYKPEYPVSDEDFLKIIAILRLAVPSTGMIISTRETPRIRKSAFKIGISQASACSATTVGGYANKSEQPQFNVSDERTLSEIISGSLDDKLLPSFCTACYRLGRTGEAFMNISKPGNIHNFCRPNGILTFAEYLEDFGKNGIYEKGYEVINYYLDKIEDGASREETRKRLLMIKDGKRDLYF